LLGRNGMKKYKALAGMFVVCAIIGSSCSNQATLMGKVTASAPVTASTAQDLTVSGISTLPSIPPTVIRENTRTLTPGSRVPESEMTNLVFSYEWLVKNNQWDDNGNSFKVTFPISWLTNPLPVPTGETSVTLRVPTQLLLHHDENPDPDVYTGSFPRSYFLGMPPSTAIDITAQSPQLIIEPPGLSFFTSAGVNPPVGAISVRAISGPLTWSVSCDAPWLSFSPGGGTVGEASQVIILTVNAASLTPGSYEAVLKFTGNPYSVLERSVWLNITEDMPGQAIPARVELDLRNILASRVVALEQAGVTVGKLGESFSAHASEGLRHYEAGSLGLFLNCTVANTDSADWQISFRAVGYNALGQSVSWMMDDGFLAGSVSRNIAGKSSRSFLFHLSWAPDVTLVKISVGAYPTSPPLP
jgi:hypothetical protein